MGVRGGGSTLMNKYDMDVLGATYQIWLSFEVIILGFDVREVVVSLRQNQHCLDLSQFLNFGQEFISDSKTVWQYEDEDRFSAICYAS